MQNGYQKNQLMRCCNLFPPYFKNINEMIEYLTVLKDIGINVVWINPIQLAGDNSMPKANAITGNTEYVTKSLYAMKDRKLIDPRFSVVQRDTNDNISLTLEQISFLFKKGINTQDIFSLGPKIEKYKQIIASIQLSLSNNQDEIKKNKESLDKHSKQEGDPIKEIEALKAQIEPLKLRKKDLENEKEKLEKDIKKNLPEIKKMLTSKTPPNPEEIKKSFGEKELIYFEKCKDLKLVAIQLNKKNSTVKHLEKVVEFEPNKQKLEKSTEALKNECLVQESKLNLAESEFEKLKQTRDYYCYLLDKAALQKFTQTAKELGIIPIFDLVLNHVAKKFDFKDTSGQNLQIFSEDNTYPDAIAFSYGYLVEGIPLTKDEKEALKKIEPHLNETEKKQLETGRRELSQEEVEKYKKPIDFICKTLWEPLIEDYIKNYHFSGARIDCIRKVPKEVRERLYNFIKKEVKKLSDGFAPVILEEALFSDMSAKEFKDKLTAPGATHITGSVYNLKQNWDGSFPYANEEDYFKKQMVDVGVINFTGNHDHYSCAMTVCRELAFERLKENKPLYNVYESLINQRKKEGKPLSHAMEEIRKSIFTHYYVNQIISELNSPTTDPKKIEQFEKMYRNKLVTNMFTGSGGYYMVSGDEVASFKQPTVFVRPDGSKIFPDTQLAIFKSDVAQEILEQMALDSIRKNYKDYKSLLLSPVEEQIKNEINAINSHKQMKNIIEQAYQEAAFELLENDKYNEIKDQLEENYPRLSNLVEKMKSELANKKSSDANKKLLNSIISGKIPENAKACYELMKGLSNKTITAIPLDNQEEFINFQQAAFNPELPHYKDARPVLEEMAANRVKRSEYKDHRSIFLSAFKEQIKNELNADFSNVQMMKNTINELYKKTAFELFKNEGYETIKEKYEQADKKGKEDILNQFIEQIKLVIKSEKDLARKPTTNIFLKEISTIEKKELNNFIKQLADKGLIIDRDFSAFPQPTNNPWQIPSRLPIERSKEFFKQMNDIFDLLPPPKDGYWSELFKIKEDVLVIVKRNGVDFTNETDIVMVNLNPNHPIEISHSDMHDLAMWMQARCVPEEKDQHQGNPKFNQSYGCIMGFGEQKANLYIGGKINFTPQVTNHFHVVNPSLSSASQNVPINIDHFPSSSANQDVLNLDMSPSFTPLRSMQRARSSSLDNPQSLTTNQKQNPDHTQSPTIPKKGPKKT